MQRVYVGTKLLALCLDVRVLAFISIVHPAVPFRHLQEAAAYIGSENYLHAKSGKSERNILKKANEKQHTK